MFGIVTTVPDKFYTSSSKACDEVYIVIVLIESVVGNLSLIVCLVFVWLLNDIRLSFDITAQLKLPVTRTIMPVNILVILQTNK